MATAAPPSLTKDDASAMSKCIDIGLQSFVRPEGCDFGEFYEIKRTVEFIKEHKARRVALQFPDSLLPDAQAVYGCLCRDTGCDCFILADTSYGSCCVDEVAAQHYNADVMVHYGDACLSRCVFFFELLYWFCLYGCC